MTAPDRLIDGYDLVVFDLDGVVYLGDTAIPTAVRTISRLCGDGVAVGYATNNASRRPAQVAEVLRRLGVPARPEQVTSSPQAAAGLLAGRLAPGTPVLVVGAEALRAEVAEAGLTPVRLATDKPAAVVQGYAAEVGWAQLAEACVAIRAGAWWVATNADRTLPSPRGPLPGNGALVAALATALDRQPDVVVGKPAPELFHRSAARAGASRPLVVGDRLDTDIAGARAAGMAGMLVLTGVATPADLLAAPAGQRPEFVAADLGALYGPAADSRVPAASGAGPWQLGTWQVRRAGEQLELSGSGSASTALALLCAVCWAYPDRPVRPAGEDAERALAELRLS